MMQEQYGRFDAYFIAPEDCGKLYLTFDEGYENGYTPQILDVPRRTVRSRRPAEQRKIQTKRRVPRWKRASHSCGRNRLS